MAEYLMRSSRALVDDWVRFNGSLRGTKNWRIDTLSKGISPCRWSRIRRTISILLALHGRVPSNLFLIDNIGVGVSDLERSCFSNHNTSAVLSIIWMKSIFLFSTICILVIFGYVLGCFCHLILERSYVILTVSTLPKHDLERKKYRMREST